MSSKAGYLKSEKNIHSDIGKTLQNIGNAGYNFFGSGLVETGMEQIGRTIGSVAIPIPIVGGMIGKKVGEKAANYLQYGSGLLGEIGQSIQDVQNGASFGQELKDVLNYIPNQVAKDWWNSELVQVATGRMSVPDAIVNGLVDYSGIKLFSDKEHAWKDKQGNYHKTYVDGAKLVVGNWQQPTNTGPKVNISSNDGILGVRGGEGKSPIGRPGPVTPWGKPALGYKTRKKKNLSNKFIVKRRNDK